MKTEDQKTSAPPLQPFQNIALAFSGGGFRAAAFSLGTLSYLENLTYAGKPLTGHVRFSSSTSGGTITNLLYTAAIHRGRTFQSFYDHTRQKLSSDTLLKKVLTVLNDDQEWNQPGQEKQRNLINAFAKVYDRELFNHEKMGVFWNKKHIPVYEVCANATEFYRGQSFRFQTDGTNNIHQKIGNKYLFFQVSELATFKRIKLADVLAASSCFPMGFEPIMYPEDYSYQDNPPGKGPSDENLQLSAETLRRIVKYENYNEDKLLLSDTPPADILPDPKQPPFIHSFGMMDGGITDNQALNSLMMADKKRRARKTDPEAFDLMIVTDVTSYFMDRYDKPEFQEKPAWRRRNISYFVTLFQRIMRGVSRWQLILGILSALLLLSGFISPSLVIRFPAWFFGSIVFTAFAVLTVLKKMPFTRELFSPYDQGDVVELIRKMLPLKKSFTDTILLQLISYLRLSHLNVLEQMFKARLSSVMTMVLDVNLKQVRRLIYGIFYAEPCWENRRVPNFIYELSQHNAQTRDKRIKSKTRLGWQPTPADKALLLNDLHLLQPIAEEARVMGTTLWFDQEDDANERLKKIIATGQFTTCCNLLEYVTSILRKKVPFDPLVIEQLKDIRQRLEQDFNCFKKHPYLLYDKLNGQVPRGECANAPMLS